MTRTEAIAILENLKIQGKSFFSQRLALDMAIEALEEDEKNAKYGSELARIVAEHDAADELMKKAEEVSNGY